MVSRELEKECIVVFDEAHNIDNVCIEVTTCTPVSCAQSRCSVAARCLVLNHLLAFMHISYTCPACCAHVCWYSAATHNSKCSKSPLCACLHGRDPFFPLVKSLGAATLSVAL